MAIGSDGVPHQTKRDWIAAPVLEYARGAGGGYSNWLGSLRAFLGHGADPYAGGRGGKGVALSESDVIRVLLGDQVPTLRESDWDAIEARSNMRRPNALTVCRWDADIWRDHATHHKPPAKDRALQDQTVNALAAIGLASCPSAPSRRGLVTPLAVSESSTHGQRIAWPIWTEPMRTANLEAALAAGPELWRRWPVATTRRWIFGRGIPVFGRASLREPDSKRR